MFKLFLAMKANLTHNGTVRMACAIKGSRQQSMRLPKHSSLSFDDLIEFARNPNKYPNIIPTGVDACNQLNHCVC